jgi:hypothetical protein
MIVETERIHFRRGLIRRPVLLRHAVGGHHNSGAISTVIAMNENFPRGVLLKQFQEFSDLRVAWRRPTAYWHIDETHAKPLGLLALASHGAAIAAQINDRSHTKFLQLGKTLRVWLCAAKENVADFSGVGHTGDF